MYAIRSYYGKYYESTMNAVAELKSKGYKIAVLEIAEGSIDITSFNPATDEKIALILGNEVNGVNQEIIDICDYCLEIPQYGTKHSLNVSVSGGIALWDRITSYNVCYTKLLRNSES